MKTSGHLFIIAFYKRYTFKKRTFARILESYMKDKTIHYTVAFAVIFVFLLGVNQFMHTQEKKVTRILLSTEKDPKDSVVTIAPQ
jgi:hypothetical protein